MRIGLIRHGETDWNAQMKLQGTTDIPLNERGVEQAEDAARLLRGSDWTRIVASPLGRARHTAEIIAAALGLEPPILIPELVERSFGVLEGEHVYRVDGSRTAIDHPSVETVDATLTRAFAAFDSIAAQFPNENVLALTHGSVIRLALDQLLEWRAPHISNVALSVLESNPDSVLGYTVRSANGYPVYPQ
ncbi:histidine phosphatase family protein [Gulosibacter molinativorax]|uniref:Histidine phosphatase family protein n=1 Tax=Gulosibacter molinativorax TaxID=256821 RepID=A0ABT7CA96_9MICO|nr:histidine phosphatase family protein [Gulosibacter molinativorax]MDJ1372030.1 histidine phosphatase family protein [Gulosibacter molinativorax]QUY63922.1 Phosphoglycerate mutase family protein [Gulosibacter molinativorax]